MKRALKSLMRSRSYFAARSVGVFFLIAGAVTAQSSQPPVANQKPGVAGAVAAASGQPNKTLPYDLTLTPDVQVKLELIHSKSQSLATDSPIARLAISDPKIIEVEQDRNDFQKVTVQALKPGKSVLTLWCEDSRDPVIYSVTVVSDEQEETRAITYSSPAAARQRILFSVDLVSVGEPSLKGWFQQHSKEPVRLFPGPIGKASPIQLPAEARLSLLTQLNRDAESSILASPSLITSWRRGASYNIGDFGAAESFFSLRLTPEEVGGREIALKVRTQLRPKADDETIAGPKDLNWDVRGPLGNAFLFPVADVASGKKLILIVRPTVASGSVTPPTPSRSGATRLPAAVAQLPVSPPAGFVAGSPETQGTVRPSDLPNVGPSVTKEAAVLQMLVLDVDSKIANDVLSRTTTVEGTLGKVGERKEWKGAAGKRESGSRNFSLTSIPGMMFVADLKTKDESFKIVARPQVRTLIDVAAALEVRGRKTPEQQVAGFGTLRIFVTPRRVDDDLAVQTHFTLSQVGKASLKTEGKSKPTYEAEATVKTSLGTTSVMALEADSTDRTILLLTDVVSVQQVKGPGQPPVASHPPAMPSARPRWVSPAPNASDPQSVGQLTPLAPVQQASGVQQSLPKVTPKSEVQQVLDEVREMRKLIKGLRDDMNSLRESVTQVERPLSNSEIWIQQNDSQVFARGKKIRTVTAHDPAIVEIVALASDRLRLTGKQAGRTTLCCLFEGEATPTTFMVEVIPASKRVVGHPTVLIPRAAAHLPAARVAQAPRSVPGRSAPAGTGQATGAATRLQIQEHHMVLFKRDKAIERVAVGASTIADFVQYSETECGIVAQKPGSTTVFIWLEGESDPEQFVVEVTPDSRAGSDSMSATGSGGEDAARRQIEEALDKQVSVDVEERTLLEAIRYLHEIAGVNVVVDSAGLEEVGISTDVKVSLALSGVTLRSALKLLLSELGLAAMIDNEVLVVTSRERAEGRQTFIAYRVSDLVQQSDGETGRFDELVTLITTVVQPDSWQEVGGNGSVAANLPTGTLVIRQTDQIHQEIEQLFDALRNWKNSTNAGMNSSVPIAVEVDELNGGRFSGFAPIQSENTPLSVAEPQTRPIPASTDDLSNTAEPPGTTGVPIDRRPKR